MTYRLATSQYELIPINGLIKDSPELERCHVGPGDATIEKISDAVAEGGDVLYIVCHGTMGDDGPRLLLHDGGRSRFVRGQQLVDAIADRKSVV